MTTVVDVRPVRTPTPPRRAELVGSGATLPTPRRPGDDAPIASPYGCDVPSATDDRNAMHHHLQTRVLPETDRTPAQPGTDPRGNECLPAVERLGTATVAIYTHAVAPPDESSRTDSPLVRPPGTAVGTAPTLDPRQACCTIAVAAVEVLTGTRPLAQLARWLTPEVYDTLAQRATLTAPRSGVLDPAAAARDLTGPDGPGAASVRRPSVRRVRSCVIGEHTIESSVVVAHADRVRAVAVRLTRTLGRWRASALVIG